MKGKKKKDWNRKQNSRRLGGSKGKKTQAQNKGNTICLHAQLWDEKCVCEGEIVRKCVYVGVCGCGVCTCMYVCERECVCMYQRTYDCVCECVCLCMYVCERERERESESLCVL